MLLIVGKMRQCVSLATVGAAARGLKIAEYGSKREKMRGKQ
jgi:hypothetical protein